MLWPLADRWKERLGSPRCGAPPLTPPQGGEVLPAGRARERAAKTRDPPQPWSVGASRSPSRVRCAGLRPPLTAPTTRIGRPTGARTDRRTASLTGVYRARAGGSANGVSSNQPREFTANFGLDSAVLPVLPNVVPINCVVGSKVKRVNSVLAPTNTLSFPSGDRRPRKLVSPILNK